MALIPQIGETRGQFEQRVAFAGGDISEGGFIQPAAGVTPTTVMNGYDVVHLGLNSYQPGPVSTNGYQTGPTHADVIPGQLGIVNGVSVSGPGVPEPPRGMVAKQWTTHAYSKTIGTFEIFFFLLIDGRIMMYNPAVKGWKIWRPKKPIVLYRGKVTLSQAVRAQRMLDKLWKTAAKRTKALKLA